MELTETRAMKLFLFTGTDGCDIETSLNWFVVAPDRETARGLWNAAVEEFLGREAEDSELDHVFVVLDDVTGTRYEGEARYVPWDEIEDLAA